ncbi:FG-GAP repeat domain-containing protein [Streptomyces hydrogenans]|uniref:FG-GAP repeat domain-containing protein n=1 Tax=Streptomyces hydrogenans TaxID=1873719 RepID=UPI0035DF0765
MDGDGLNELLYRGVDGELYATTTDRGPYALYTGSTIDIVPIGDQGGLYARTPELLTVSEDGQLVLHEDAYHSGVRERHVVGGGWQVYNKVVSPGDVNNDGRADVIARTHEGQLYLYLATGTLGKPLGTRISVGGGWSVYDQVVGAGDANGDGRGDLYARDFNGTLWFYAGTGNTSRPFATRKSVGTGWNIYNQIIPSGNGGLWARDDTGTLYDYAPNGNGTLASRKQKGAVGEWADVTQFASSGSISHTGKNEVLATTPGGSAYWYKTSTTGKLAPRALYLSEGNWKGFPYFSVSSTGTSNVSAVALVWEGRLTINDYLIGGGWGIYDHIVGPGDLSGDGRGDLLARDRSGVLYLYRSKPDIAFETRIRIGSGWGVYNAIVGSGDYTSDGRKDLLARTTGGDLYLYAGTGNATTPFKSRVKIGSGWNVYKRLVAPGDLNSDGKGDLLGITPAGELYRYLNTSPSKLAPRTKIGTGFQIYNSMT